MNFLLAYPATLAAKRERLIIFRCVIGKKKLPKKKKLQQTELTVFPQYPPPRHRTIGTID